MMSIRARHVAFYLLASGAAVAACASDQATPAPDAIDAGPGDASPDTAAPGADASDASAVDGGCEAGTNLCEGRCVDTSSDVKHCGQCGRACAAGQTCGGGGCLCAGAKLVACGDACLDPKIDRSHCGATPGCGVNLGYAGDSCPSDGYCNSGACTSCRTWTEVSPITLIGNHDIVRTVVRDFNLDGHLDIAFSDPVAGMVGMLLGNGDGTFAAPTSFSIGTSGFLAAGDFDHDGVADVATASAVGTQATILRGKGDGTFEAGGTFETGGVLGAVGDVNGDAHDDLAVALTGQVRIFLWGSGGFTAGPTFTLLGTSYSSKIAVADFDGDGKRDVLTDTGRALVFARGKGNGSFDPPWSSLHADTFPEPLTVADVNGDGKLDALSGTRLYLGQASGNFSLLPSPLALTPRDVVLDRLSADPNVDLLYTDNGFNGTTSGLFFRAGKGNGGFYAAQLIVTLDKFVAPKLVTGDFNGDGKPDIVMSDRATFRVLLGSSSTDPRCP